MTRISAILTNHISKLIWTMCPSINQANAQLDIQAGFWRPWDPRLDNLLLIARCRKESIILLSPFYGFHLHGFLPYTSFHSDYSTFWFSKELYAQLLLHPHSASPFLDPAYFTVTVEAFVLRTAFVVRAGEDDWQTTRTTVKTARKPLYQRVHHRGELNRINMPKL